MIRPDELWPERWPVNPGGLALSAYLLGGVSLEQALRLQRRLHFDITGQRDHAAVVLCEHPPGITIGRHGSVRHLHLQETELRVLGWPVSWLPRGGGCWLHGPGQLAIYLLVPLDEPHGVAAFQARFSEVMRRVLDDFSVRGSIIPEHGGVAVGNRLLGALGFGVRDGVTTYGGCLNVNPDLEYYHWVRSHPLPGESMTSLERERRGRVRPAHVRQQLLEHLVAVFGFSRVALFTDHPALSAPAPRRRARPAAPQMLGAL